MVYFCGDVPFTVQWTMRRLQGRQVVGVFHARWWAGAGCHLVPHDLLLYGVQAGHEGGAHLCTCLVGRGPRWSCGCVVFSVLIFRGGFRKICRNRCLWGTPLSDGGSKIMGVAPPP